MSENMLDNWEKPDVIVTVVDIEVANQDLLTKSDRGQVVYKTSKSVGKKLLEEAPAPRAEPYFEVRFGDSKHDQIETDDREVLCITAANPYSNVHFRDLIIFKIWVTDENGVPVDKLPNGTPSVNIVPSGMVSFGDLHPGSLASPCRVTREVVLESKGARSGDYILQIQFTYSIEFRRMIDSDGFVMTLYAS